MEHTGLPSFSLNDDSTIGFSQTIQAKWSGWYVLPRAVIICGDENKNKKNVQLISFYRIGLIIWGIFFAHCWITIVYHLYLLSIQRNYEILFILNLAEIHEIDNYY